MLNVSRDSQHRSEDQGQFFVELVNHIPFMGHPQEKVNRFGYWCDKGHLKHMILALMAQFTTYELFAHLLEEPRQNSGGQSPQAPNSRYATALDVVQQYVKEVANSESSNFVDWLYQRLNPAERDSA
jgi:hypothetical protein